MRLRHKENFTDCRLGHAASEAAESIGEISPKGKFASPGAMCVHALCVCVYVCVCVWFVCVCVCVLCVRSCV